MDDHPNIHNSKDVIKLWQPRPPVLREAVDPNLWYLVTGAAIEWSFSLAVLVDVNNRQSMGNPLGAARPGRCMQLPLAPSPPPPGFER